MKHIILIELDVLLDTRLGLLSSIDESISTEVLEKGWGSRQSDEVSVFTDRITDEEFKKRWENRTADILPYSRISNYILELKDMVEQLEEQILTDTGRIKDSAIIVNTYPYLDLEEDELFDLLETLKELLGTVIPIRIGKYKPEEIDLPMLKDNHILTYVVYDWITWMNKAMAPCKGQDAMVCNPKLTIIAPKLINKLEDLNSITRQDIETMGNLDIFGVLQIYWAPVFGLAFCPSELMSLINPSIFPD